MTRWPRAGVLALVLLCAPARVDAAADATWKTHRDQNCGVELRYPPSHEIDASGAGDHCALWLRIGTKEARGLRALFSLEIRERSSADPPPPSARDFALHLATIRCGADGPDGTTYCTNGEVRSTFRTAQGFRVWEIHATEVHETFAPKRIQKRRRGPVFALDLSDDEVVRVLMAETDGGRQDALKGILDTLRVWTKARREMPRVVELQPYRAAPQAFSLRVATEERYGTRWPPAPVTSWFLTDPRGRRLGKDPVTGTWHSEVPAVTQSTMGDSGFMLRESVEGRYELQVSASIPSVRYQVAVQAPDRDGKPASARQAGRTAEPGSIDRYEVVYSRAAAPAVAVAEVRDLSRLTVLLSSRGDVASELILTDPRGRQTGLDPAGKVEHRKIPRSSYLDEGIGQRSMALHVRQPMDGAYTLQVTGTAMGSYSLDLRGSDRGGATPARPELRDVPTEPGVVHLYRLDYTATAKTPLKLGGGFNASRLLVYANPTSGETRLGAGVTGFPLVIFYGAGIRPVTFNAVLNGDNVSGRFTPQPEGYQIVRIPLAPGLNTLTLSVEGTLASGQTTTDTDRLVFRVE